MPEAGDAGEAPKQSKLLTAEQRQRVAVGGVLGRELAGTTEGAEKSVGKKVREVLHTKGHERALQVLAEETAGDPRKNTRDLIEKFGTERDASTGNKKRIGAEKTRYDTAEAASTQVIDFLEKGYDQLDTDAQKKDVRDLVAKAFGNNPLLREAFEKMSPDDKKQHLEKMLRDPKFTAQLRTRLQQITSRDLTPELDVLKAKGEAKVTNVDREASGKKTKRLEDEYTALDKRLGEIQHGTLSDPETLTDKLSELKSKIDTAELEITDKEIQKNKNSQEIEALRRRAAALERRLTMMRGNPAEQTALVGQLDNIEATIGDKESSITTLERAIASNKRELIESTNNRTTLLGSVDELTAHREELHKDIPKATRKEALAQNEYLEKQLEARELETQRTNEEDAIVADLGGAFAEAGRRQLLEDLQHSFQSLDEAAEGVQDKMMKDAHTAMKQTLETRWIRTVQRRRGLFRRYEPTPLLDQRAIDQDYHALLRGGPEQLMRTILRNSRPEGTRRNYNADEVDKLLETGFSEEVSQDLTKQIIARRLLTRKLRPAEVHQIVNSDWGGDMIEQAIESNADFRGTIENLTGSDQIDTHDPVFRRRLSQEILKSPGLLLFPVTTLPWLLTALIRAGYSGAKAGLEDERKPLGRQLAA